MRKITSIFALLVVVATSCLNENEFQKESIFKTDILNYLEQFKESVNDDGDQKIDALIKALDFRQVSLYAPKGKEELLVVGISSLNGFAENEKLNAIFFINQGAIVRSSLLALSNHTKAEELIISFFNSAIPKNYSGKISIYNTLQNIEFFSVLENGELRANGNINGSKNKEAGKTNGCIDWFLVTTFYYADGSRRTTDYFLFRTCDCEEQNSRMGRVSCGEGGGNGTPGTGAPVFPSNAQPGDIYEYRYYDGKKIIYEYIGINHWQAIEVELPEATIQSHPLTYPYLLTDGPTDGMAILGPDNFLYKFKGATGNWVGLLCIQNQLTDPCLNGVADDVLDPTLISEYNTLLQGIFNSSDEVNWILLDQNNVSGNAHTPASVCNNGILNITTWLDIGDLANKPKEFIATTILHEGLHAILHLRYGDNTNPTSQHIQMLSDYLDQISSAVNEAYPSIPIEDVKGLLLMEIFPLNIVARTAILNKTGYTESEILAIFQDYNSGSKGTPCN